MNTTPQGWYRDPADETRVRWFDGAAWTASSEPAPEPGSGPLPPPAARRSAVTTLPPRATSVPTPHPPVPMVIPLLEPDEEDEYVDEVPEPLAPQPAAPEPVAAEQYAAPADEPGYAQPDLAQPGYAQPDFAQQGHGQPDLTQPAYAPAPFVDPLYAPPPQAAQLYVPAQYADPQSAEPTSMQPQYGEPAYAQPQYAPTYAPPQQFAAVPPQLPPAAFAPQTTPAPYGAGFAQAPYGQPQAAGWHGGPPPGKAKKSTATIVLIVLASVLVGVIALGIVAAIAIPVFLNQREKANIASLGLTGVTCAQVAQDAVQISASGKAQHVGPLVSMTAVSLAQDNRATVRVPASGADPAFVMSCVGTGTKPDGSTGPVSANLYIDSTKQQLVAYAWGE